MLTAHDLPRPISLSLAYWFLYPVMPLLQFVSMLANLYVSVALTACRVNEVAGSGKPDSYPTCASLISSLFLAL
ncbi:uncharacterized protein BCR38DRAFT_441360 [Pseudomassariella vexata]|uniref:Uncharacterized protein n=1 Tax=Pseudomassariella vexata TaxID=1141098 RepID=A0A1Y2DMZ8_9PEZI|nr:uncharacterized protein BCR38DRAFT_441360 [Pseudomassariella vexata]ORY60534.1 hypothetical protein BCR38DRAFT_441360 [Pseudomassariella vexata]